MKHFISAILLLGSSMGASAQLSITSAGAMTISSGTVFSYDGLVLQPSTDYTNNAALSLVRNNAITQRSTTPAIARAYTLSAPLTGFSGAITMPYAMGELNGIPEGSLQLNMYNGASWSAFPGVLNTATKTVTVSGLSNAAIGEVSLASSAAPLPLNLVSFTGTTSGTANLFSWKTADERALSRFELERSADGIAFSAIAHIAAGNREGAYSYSDIAGGQRYYRLRSIDQNGDSRLSGAIRLGGEAALIACSLAPNPAAQSLRLEVPALSGSAQVAIMDQSGRIVLQQAVSASATILNVSTLLPGVYLVRFRDDRGEQVIRLNKL